MSSFEFVPFAGMTMTVLIVLIVFGYAFAIRKMKSKEIITAIEKGVDVPMPEPKKRDVRQLGYIWLLVGIALMIAIGTSSGSISSATWGLVPIAVGVALLLSAKGSTQ